MQKPIVCSGNEQIIVGDKCCSDTNNDGACDEDQTQSAQANICGNTVCDSNENCTTCWKDCGACKRIVYIYVPRNFSLSEFSEDLNKAYTDEGMKFKRDITAINNVSDFYYYADNMPRYFAEFMSISYKPMYISTAILLNGINNENYYVNTTDGLFKYVNYSNWYITHQIKSREQKNYEDRITTGKATEDYPTAVSGYQKQYKYAKWEYRNHTKNTHVIYDNISLLPNGMVESIYSAITQYDIIYKYHQYAEKGDTPIEAFKNVDEFYLGYVHSVTFGCSRNLAVTVYNYDYNNDMYKLNEDSIKGQVPVNRQKLLDQAARIKLLCDAEYSEKIFKAD
jgi:hypothetical protein